MSHVSGLRLQINTRIDEYQEQNISTHCVHGTINALSQWTQHQPTHIHIILDYLICVY